MPRTHRGRKPGSGSRVSKAPRAHGGSTGALPDHGRPSVVGIGASAGGLEALKAFLGAMPPKTGLAFVVVVHLDPTHESLMPELLSHVTGLTVEQARDGQPLEADHVYVIPPNRTLTIERNLLRVSEVADRRSLRGTIDRFFRSLAEAERDRAIAIVLSGTGTEGTLGARAVKGENGLVMVQAPDTAAYPGMPTSVIATALTDVVLAPDQMPQALLAYVRNTAAYDVALDTPEAKPLDGLPAILAVLRARTKYDFRGYKTGTLQRRIERRMGLLQIDDVPRYLDLLRSQPAEVDRLFKQLLIGVTSFFRDPPAFEELSDVFAALVRERDQDVPIRIWVPACSTGEEAYSIAILLAEQMAAAQSSCRTQIFATDVDNDALEIARAGTYPENIALDVTPQRLQRFFTHEDHRYRIAKSLRDSIVFAVQNLTRDPPFSKLDLVSCRNVLIYLEPEMQEKLLSSFHFALKSGGYLFLGGAESIGLVEELFNPVSRGLGMFRRLGRLPTRPQLEVPVPSFAATDAGRVAANVVSEPTMATLVDQLLLDHFAPAAVVVRSNGHIVRFYGGTERYITLPRGEATLDVLALARDVLKPTLRAALSEAVRRNRKTTLETLDVRPGRKRATLRVTVTPLDRRRIAERLWVIVFEEVSPPARVTSRTASRGQMDLVRRLETELRVTKKEQQRLVERLEAGNQELKTANEEVVSMNEELQSANQELTTSKEELQSMNEELTTLNAELQDNVQELTAVNDDLANLLVSTDIATVFLDTDLRIKRFTKAASHVLNLQKSDTGRPMNHIASNLAGVDLARDARTVLDTSTSVEKEVSAQGGGQYFLRVLPYRTEDKTIQGVVLTLVDMTSLKRAERDLRAAREQLAEDLRRMTRLHGLSAQLVGPGDIDPMLDNVIRAAVEITTAETGIIQRCDDAGVLTIASQTGFDRPFLDFFAHVDAHTDSACGVVAASRRRVVVEDVTTSRIFAGSAALAVMTEAGVRAMQSTPLFDRSDRFLGVFSTHYRQVHDFKEPELRWVDLLARHAADVIERQSAEELLAHSHRQLEARVASRTQWLTLMVEVAQAINGAPIWTEALHRALRVLCDSDQWQVGFVYLQDPKAPDLIAPVISCIGDERFRQFHDLSNEQRYLRGQSLPGRVFAENLTIWVNEANDLQQLLPLRAEAARAAALSAVVAVPIVVGSDTVGVLELCSDKVHPPDDRLVMLMSNVGDQLSRVIERERATARMADLVWTEQQQLLHTLHDSLGQTLTGLGMLSAGLSHQLAADSETNQTATHIAQQAQEALDQVRQLTRSLFPVEVDARSVMVALRNLARATESLSKIPVRVEGAPPAGLRNGKVATELYRIAQEAVTNAVKHADARAITIRFDHEPGVCRLHIGDDGVGIQPGVGVRSDAPSDGMGLQIMRYRAASIGASLSIERGAAGGTVVTCTLREPPALRPEAT